MSKNGICLKSYEGKKAGASKHVHEQLDNFSFPWCFIFPLFLFSCSALSLGFFWVGTSCFFV